jgi:SSS family solute:Na+ symporter
LVAGIVLGVGRLVLEVNEVSPSGWLGAFVSMNFLHFAVLLFVVCAAVLVLVSLWTKPPDAARVMPLTVHGHAGVAADATRTADIAWSLVVVGLVGVAWLYFSA